MSHLWQDVRYGIRMLLGKPGFTTAAVLVLALGVGANSAIFSLVNAFLLKPLQIVRPRELVGCYSRDTRKPDNYRAFSYPNFVDLREKNSVFTSLMAHNMAMVGLTEGDSTRRVFADIVSSNYFSTFGVPLFRGRAFTPAEEKPESNPAVVIVNHSFWKRTGADPALMGKTLHINGRPFTVIGITPEGFTGATALVTSDLYLPLGVYSTVMNDFEGQVRPLSARDNHNLILVGRLRAGLTIREADAQLAVVAAQMANAFPEENRNQTFLARPLSRLAVTVNPANDREIGVPAALLMSMAGVVLLIASLNIANMMLARGTARRREIAIRLAIGSGRGRIVRQLFTEGMILATLGGAAGLVMASWSTAALVRSLVRLAPVAIVYSASPDVRVVSATAVFCILSTIIFSVWPAWRLSKPDVSSDLKESMGEEAAGGARRLFSRRNLLVTAQLALSLMMLSAAGLFVRSALRAARVEPGFSLDNEVLAEVDPRLAGYDEARGRQLYPMLLARLRSIPAVESASLAATVPFGMISQGRNITPVDRKSTVVEASFNIVSDDYFRTLRIPLLQGRSFRASETPHVAILDKLAAGRLWPGGNAVGRHIRMDSQDLEVVGVVGSVQDHIIGGTWQPHLYVPFGQFYLSDMQIHLRAPASALESIRREIRAFDDHLPVLALKTLRDHMESGFDLWIVRTGARMLAIFGAVALMLAMIGMYGVKAYTVARRTREIGIRMALGASSTDTLRMILRESLFITMAGAGAGMALALAVGRVLAGMLYEVRAFDPVVLLTASLLLVTASLVASYLPARKAARVDPMVALRYE